jgi:hypothetical protein
VVLRASVESAQYAATAFVIASPAHGLIGSMGRRGNPLRGRREKLPSKGTKIVGHGSPSELGLAMGM